MKYIIQVAVKSKLVPQIDFLVDEIIKLKCEKLKNKQLDEIIKENKTEYYEKSITIEMVEKPTWYFNKIKVISSKIVIDVTSASYNYDRTICIDGQVITNGML